MAKIKSGIFGPLSGKLGTLIGATWKGIGYLKKVPEKKSTKCSPGLVASQTKLKFINIFLLPFHTYLTVGFANDAVGRTEISAALSRNYHDAFPWENDEVGVDYAKFRISMGTLPMVDDLSAVVLEDEIHITWKSVSRKGVKFDDQLMVAVFAPKTQAIDGCIGGARRGQMEWKLAYGPDLAGQLVHIFVSMTSVNRKLIANSVYLGTLQL